MAQKAASQPAIERNPLADCYILLAWDIFRDDNPKKPGERYPSVHTAWTPFNSLFRKLFPGLDPVAYTRMLQEQGLVMTGLTRGGALLKPCEGLFCAPPKEHKQTIAGIKKAIEAAAEEHRKKKAAREAKKAETSAASATDKPTSKRELDARKAWKAGDTVAALKRLGIG